MSGNTGACNFTDIFSGSTPHKIPTIRDTALVFGIIGIIYVLVSLCRLMYYKNKYDHLRKRSILYAAVTSLGVLLQIFGGTLNIGLNYPCWIAVALTMFCFPLLIIPVPLRMLDHFAKYIYAKSLLGLQVQKNVELSHSDQSDSWFSAIINVFSFVIKQLIKGGSTNSTGNHGNSSAQIVASSSASVQSISLQGESTQVGKQQKVISMKSIMLLKFLTSSYAQVLVCVLCMFPFVLIIILDFQKHEYLKPSNDCRGCAVSTDQTTVMLACGCVIIALAVIVAIIVRRYPDPFGIMTECRMSMQYGGVIGIIGLLLTNYHPQTDAGKYSFIFIILIGELVIQFVCTDYQIIIAKRVQPKLTRRQRRKQAGRNGAKSTQITETESEDPKGKSLREYIESPESAGFEEYLVGEYSIELIRMYHDCRYYEENYFDMNENTKRARVKKIVSLYVLLNSPLEVNLPYVIKEDIKKAAASSEPLPQSLFKESQNEILMMLASPYQRYLTLQEKQKSKATPTVATA